jgi:hypothetical protein
MAMRTPCCGAPFATSCGYAGAAYMQERTVECFECGGRSPEERDCQSQWHPDGTPAFVAVTDGGFGTFMFDKAGVPTIVPERR